jgi:hypothetical protein
MPSPEENIALIRAYTAMNAELKLAHHFLYDLRSPPDGQPKFVVMGINPGEVAGDWSKSPTPTEETSEYDFHVELGDGRERIRWTQACRYILDGEDYVQAELFFWSSSRSGRSFRDRFGPLEKSRHLPLCTVLNEKLITHYQPRAVVFVGIGQANLVSRLYELREVATVFDGRERVVVHMTDGRRPWFVTKHWTGAYGFSSTQRDMIRNYVRTNSLPR